MQSATFIFVARRKTPFAPDLHRLILAALSGRGAERPYTVLMPSVPNPRRIVTARRRIAAPSLGGPDARSCIPDLRSGPLRAAWVLRPSPEAGLSRGHRHPLWSGRDRRRDLHGRRPAAPRKI